VDEDIETFFDLLCKGIVVKGNSSVWIHSVRLHLCAFLYGRVDSRVLFSVNTT
jgi:hypothetical protein